MTLEELKNQLDTLSQGDNWDDRKNETVVIATLGTVTFGPISMSNLDSMSSGFDWERGKFILWPKDKLSKTK